MSRNVRAAAGEHSSKAGTRLLSPQRCAGLAACSRRAAAACASVQPVGRGPGRGVWEQVQAYASQAGCRTRASSMQGKDVLAGIQSARWAGPWMKPLPSSTSGKLLPSSGKQASRGRSALVLSSLWDMVEPR